MDDAGQVTQEHLAYAAKLFQWGQALNRHCTLCNIGLGDVLLRLEQTTHAEAAMRSQIRLLPGDTDAHFALGIALGKQKRHDEAIDAYEQGLSINAEDAEAYLNLATSLSHKGAHEREAAAYRHAVRLKPDHALGWMNLGGCLALDLTRPNEAIGAYRAAARAFASAGRQGEAVRHFRVLERAATQKRRPEYAPLAAALGELARGETNKEEL